MGDPVRIEYPDPELRDGVVRLRRWAMDDIDCIEQASQDQRIPQGTTVPAVYTPDEGRAFILRQWGRQTDGDGLSLAIADANTDEAVGLIVLMLQPVPATVDIGYWVVPNGRRRGRATSAIRMLSRWAVEEVGMVRIGALVMPDNEPSLRALARCGFQWEGVLRQHYYAAGKHHDMVSLSLLSVDLER